MDIATLIPETRALLANICRAMGRPVIAPSDMAITEALGICLLEEPGKGGQFKKGGGREAGSGSDDGGGKDGKGDSDSKEKPAKKQKAKSAAEPSHAQQSLHSAIDSNASLSPEHKAAYKADLSKAMERMPAKAHERIAEHAKSTTFYPNADAMRRGITEDMIAGLKDKHDPKLLDIAKQRFADSLGKDRVAGCFSTNDGKLHLDGGDLSDAQNTRLSQALGGEGAAGHHIYAHELTHAIDGPNHELSNSTAFGMAYATEIWRASGEHPLTEYASSSHAEGFAEFGRLIYAGNVDLKAVAKKFPQTSKFFKDNGLWPQK